MKYLSVVAVFGLIAIVAANDHYDSVVPNTLHRLRRQSQVFSSSSSSSSSSASGGGNGAPGTFHQTSSSIQGYVPLNTGTTGVNLEDRFGGGDTGGNGQPIVTGHFQSVGGYIDPSGQPHYQHNVFQQYPTQYSTTNNQQQN